MHTQELKILHTGHRRGRYSNELKHRVIAACLEKGVSTDDVALANGVPANLARRWVIESTQILLKTAATSTPVHANPGRPVNFKVVNPALPASHADIHVELHHGATTVHIHWPISESSKCAQWLREILA